MNSLRLTRPLDAQSGRLSSAPSLPADFRFRVCLILMFWAPLMFAQGDVEVPGKKLIEGVTAVVNRLGYWMRSYPRYTRTAVCPFASRALDRRFWFDCRNLYPDSFERAV